MSVPFLNKRILAAFPNAVMALEFAFGADLASDPNTWTWTDTTAKIRQVGGSLINISTIGRPDEASQSRPAECSFTLDNTNGDFTPYNPASQYYPNFRRNTPVRVWVSLTGNPVNKVVLFQGYASGFVPSWDSSAKDVTVSVSASGITRRLGQGSAVNQSSLYRFHMLSYRYDPPTNTTGFMGTGQGYHGLPAHYWPLEEESASLQAIDVIDTNGGLKADAFATLPKFGERTVGTGTKPIAVFEATHTLRANFVPVPLGFSQVTSSTMQGIRIPFLFNLPEIPATAFEVVRVLTTGDIARISLFVELFSPTIMMLKVRVYDAANVELGATANVNDNGTFGTDVWQSIEINQDGADAKIGLAYSVHSTSPQNGIPLNSAASRSVTIAGTTVTAVTSILIAPNADMPSVAIGHLAVYNGGEGTFPSTAPRAVRGRTGDPVDVRLRRLCIENNIPLTVVGSTSSTTMGPQGVDSILTQLRECETAEQGVLYDGVSAGLTFVTRDARYNANANLTINAASDQLVPPFAPVDNDQRNVNVVKADRKTGSARIFERTDGPLGTDTIGVYDTSVNVNVATEDALLDYAAWLVHLGTVEGLRYPQLIVDLGAVPALISAWLACTVSSRIDVTNISSRLAQHPTGDIRLLLEGWSQSLSQHDWRVTANVSPYSSYVVNVLDTSGFLDCGSCYLNEPLDTTETGVDVAVNDSCSWTHASGDYDIIIGGEEMTVTAVGSLSTTVTFVNAGTASSADATSVTPGMPASTIAGDLLVVFGSARDTNADPELSISDSAYVLLVDHVNFRLWGKVHTGSESAPTVNFTNGVGDTVIAQMAAFRGKFGYLPAQVIASAAQLNASAQNINYPALSVDLDGCVVLVLGWKADDWTSVATLSGFTEIGEPSSTAGNDAGIVWDYVLQTTATNISAGSFTVTGGASAISRSAVIALRAAQQTLTVTRSVNSVVKTHSVGEEVHVAEPFTLAL